MQTASSSWEMFYFVPNSKFYDACIYMKLCCVANLYFDFCSNSSGSHTPEHVISLVVSIAENMHHYALTL